ncbi:MAG: alpha-L-fucosidase [Saprospiraceae bacterium]|nr:MAG: alpha-L-fucosidase [Saprospiraceae bacterium]
MKKTLSLFVGLLLTISCLMAQHGEDRYVPETDPLVLEKLDQWQDLKFGLLMHWGAYSQWGIVESWSICAEDEGWCERKKGAHPQDYTAYKQEYENLQTTFNPVQFTPDKWAKAAKDAGMKYVVFTTKHHDGFSMFDTKYTDYKITDPTCPFNSHTKANVTKEIFDAFRKEGLWTGAYFSKPDWHCPDYWWPNFATPDRNVNYDPAVYPDRWERYVQFTHNQIMELMTDYGKVDILWLDGGWVQKQNKESILEFYKKRLENSESGFLKGRIVNQDIRMDELVDKARAKQPGLIVVDRAVHGKNQNYLTPENRVPEAALPYPWESCIIAGGSWSWVPDAKYMSGREVVHLLADIVSKGGNLLLNIAPDPKGNWDKGAYEMLTEMGDWMKINSEAIYGTRAIAPYKEDNVCITEAKDGSLYLIYLAKEGETQLPAEIKLSKIQPKKGTKAELLGSKAKLKWEPVGEGCKVMIPEKMRGMVPGNYAWVVRIR